MPPRVMTKASLTDTPRHVRNQVYETHLFLLAEDGLGATVTDIVLAPRVVQTYGYDNHIEIDETDAPLFRPPVQPNERNGLRAPCRLMVDKITTVPKTKVDARVGRLDNEDILRLNQAVFVFLDLAVWPRAKPEA